MLDENSRQLFMQKHWIKSKIDKALIANNIRHEKAVSELQQHAKDQVIDFALLAELNQKKAQYVIDMVNFEEYCNSLEDCQQLRAIALVIALEENAFDNINEIIGKANLME